MGEQRLLAQVKALGFGLPTGLSFPGESPGLLADRCPVGADRLRLAADRPGGRGQALQVLDAYNTVANNGVFVAPKLVAGDA